MDKGGQVTHDEVWGSGRGKTDLAVMAHMLLAVGVIGMYFRPVLADNGVLGP